MIAGLLLLVTGLLLWLLAPAWDMGLYRALHVTPAARALPMLVRLTDAGGATVMVPIGLALALWLAMRGHRYRALWLVASIAGGRIIVELAKVVLGRDRPPIADRLVSVSSASFPSSHSAGTMLTCVAICLVLRAGWIGWSAAVMFILAIGFTRIALGVHWPSDVIAGWGFGLFWIATLAGALPASAKPRNASGDDQMVSPLDGP